MTSMTKHDAINGAMSLADDIAQGRLDPAALEAQAVTELRELVGTVVGPGDACWELQCNIARQVLALDGIPATELAEWLAVTRQRAGEPVSVADPAETLPMPESLTSSTPSADEARPEVADDGTDAGPEPEPEPEPPEPQPIPPRRPGHYDPLRGWAPGDSLQR